MSADLQDMPHDAIRYEYDFSGQVILITGAARRVGATLARRFHRAGARIVVHYRNSQREAASLASELEDARADSVRLVRHALNTQADAQRVVIDAARAWGRLDILINNASTFYPTPLADVTTDDVERIVGSNFLAPLYLSQASLPYLEDNHGAILNMADVHALGHAALSGHCLYAPAKAALVMLTRVLARDLAPSVRVNAIAPGVILWPEGDASVEQIEQQKLLDKLPAGRSGSPDDVADAALFLCGPAAGYITGQVLAVDGGRSLGLR